MIEPTITASLDKPSYQSGETMALTVACDGFDTTAGALTITVTDGSGEASTTVTYKPASTADRTLTDGEHFPDGFTVPIGEVWEFPARQSTTVTSGGNVIVHGTLRMRPASAAIEHRLTFVDIDESRFVGGGMRILPTDVGLWVESHGMLDAQGTERAGWNRTGTDPSWLEGDDLRQAPYELGDYTTFATHSFDQPAPTVGAPLDDVRTEIFNLTRNVIIGGTPEGRAHVMFLHVHSPQTIRHVRFEHVGPRQNAADKVTDVVNGRYGLHFHHSLDGTRGTLVEGVVVAHCGTRAFVPHASHGITMRDCIAYDIADEAYWWDPDTRFTYPANATHDLVLDHCAAFDIGRQAGSRHVITLSAFSLGQGVGNKCVDSVVAGLALNGIRSSAFEWPEESALPFSGDWEFSGCVAHNNRRMGVFFWQSDPWFHLLPKVDNLLCYRNGDFGILGGAYISRVHYRGGRLVQNSVEDRQRAQLAANAGWGNGFEGYVIDPGRCSDYALLLDEHRTTGDKATLITRCDLKPGRKSAIGVDRSSVGGRFDFVDVTVDGQRDLEPDDFHIVRIHPDSRFRVQRRDGTAYEVTAAGIRDIEPFHHA